MKALGGLVPGGKSMVHAEAVTHKKEASEEEIREFAKGAAMNVAIARKPAKKKPAMAKRFNFSLTQKVSDTIDKLSRWPRTFNASRSDVIRAGVLALQRMDRAEALKLMAEVTGEDPHDPQLVDGE